MLKQALRPLARVGLHLVAAGAVALALVPDAGAASVNVGTVITAGAAQLAGQITETALAQAETATSQIPGVAQSTVAPVSRSSLAEPITVCAASACAL